MHYQIHISWGLDQRLRGGWLDLLTLQQIGELDVAVADTCVGGIRLPPSERLPRHHTIHPTQQRLERRWLPVLCLPPRWNRSALPWSSLLAAVDQSVAKAGGVCRCDREVH